MKIALHPELHHSTSGGQNERALHAVKVSSSDSYLNEFHFFSVEQSGAAHVGDERVVHVEEESQRVEHGTLTKQLPVECQAVVGDPVRCFADVRHLSHAAVNPRRLRRRCVETFAFEYAIAEYFF